MYAVILSGHSWTNLSKTIKTSLVTLERISFAYEVIEVTSNNIEQILLNDVKKLDHWIHSKKPCNSKSKKIKFY